jgi:hypothetical protein
MAGNEYPVYINGIAFRNVAHTTTAGRIFTPYEAYQYTLGRDVATGSSPKRNRKLHEIRAGGKRRG